VAGFHNEEHTRRSGLNGGKLNREVQPHQLPIRCPECGSQRVWKDGLRHLADMKIQRYLCRDCAFRFSESTQANVKLNIAGQLLEVSNPKEDHTESRILPSSVLLESPPDKSSLLSSEDVGPHSSSHSRLSIEKLKDFRYYNSNRRVCVPEGGMINLAEVKPQQEEAVAGAKLKPIEAEAKILEHAWRLKKEGYKESTICNRVYILKRLIKLGADLSDPESVKDAIARQDISESTKLQMACAYDSYASSNQIRWEIPNYRQVQKLPFIPLESEIDALIAGCGKKTAVVLQLIKETGMRIGEVWRLKWTDLDFEADTVRVNEPEKNSNPRILKVSNKLAAMLNALPRTTERVFGAVLRTSVYNTFWEQRRRIAQKLQNPRLLQISFHTLRHWKATTEYHRTRDILYVKQLLGHKSISNTLIYTQLISFESDEYSSAVAKTLDEARKLVEAGFEYVTDVDGNKLFRKRK